MTLRPRRHLWGVLVTVLALLLGWCGATSADDPARALQQELAGLMAHPALRGADVGISVASVPDGEVLYRLDEGQALTPASTVKLLVSASAVRLLDADFVYHTSVWTPIAPTEEGTIPGDLIIAGTADPTANRTVYTEISRQLKAQGITAIGGGIVGAGPVAATEKDRGLSAAQALHQALGSKGISAGQGASEGVILPGAYLVYRQQSVALCDYLRAMNVHSDNRRAVLLLSSLASNFGNPGDPGHGFIGQLWQDAGLDASGLRLVEGSGMSHRNKITPALLTAVLVEMAHDADELQVLVDSLPVAGVRGTLSGRMRGTVAAGRVYAKTGTLKRVSCLAGYVCTDGAPRLAFALMMNGYSCSVSKARRIQDQAVIHMVKYALAQTAAAPSEESAEAPPEEPADTPAGGGPSRQASP